MPSDYAKKQRDKKAKAAPVLPPVTPPITPPGGHDYALKIPLGVDYSAWEPGMVIANMEPRPVFVYSRATLGKAYIDPLMRYYEMQSWALGIPFSPYHFATKDDPQVQVENFMRATIGMDWSDKEPPMLDAEYSPGIWSKIGINPRGEKLANIYKAILDGLERETGVVPWIYTSQGMWGYTFYDPTGKKDKNNMQTPPWTGKYPLICAWYPDKPDAFDALPARFIPSGFKDIRGWQYAANGRSAGYVTIANDLNVMLRTQ
jgi:GH25 family lysozyme M1 (1,4-beta-N-acetylmuramidase)